MSNYIRLAPLMAANWVLNCAAHQSEEDNGNQNVSTSFIALGTIAALGFLYYLNNRLRMSDTDYAIENLNQAGILTQENRNVLLAYNGPVTSATRAVTANLLTAGILTQDNFNAVFSSGADIYLICHAILALHRAGILTPENRNICFDRDTKTVDKIVLMILRLRNHGILTQENLSAVASGDHERLQEIADRSAELHREFNQEVFDEIILAADANSALPCKCAE